MDYRRIFFLFRMHRKYRSYLRTVIFFSIVDSIHPQAAAILHPNFFTPAIFLPANLVTVQDSPCYFVPLSIILPIHFLPLSIFNPCLLLTPEYFLPSLLFHIISMVPEFLVTQNPKSFQIKPKGGCKLLPPSGGA